MIDARKKAASQDKVTEAGAVELDEDMLGRVSAGGDGTVDSIWLDLGYPLRKAPQERQIDGDPDRPVIIGSLPNGE